MDLELTLFIVSIVTLTYGAITGNMYLVGIVGIYSILRLL